MTYCTYHRWSVATHSPPLEPFAAEQSDASQFTSFDCRATASAMLSRSTTKGTYPFGAAVREGVEVLVQEVGEAGVVLHRDFVRGGLRKRGMSVSLMDELGAGAHVH